MNEVSTTIVAYDAELRVASDGDYAGLRFVRTANNDLRINGAFAEDDRSKGVLLSLEDAHALRDWLNEEFPDDCECEVGGIDTDPYSTWGHASPMKIVDEQDYTLTPWGYVRA